jgi:hypothetical protein
VAAMGDLTWPEIRLDEDRARAWLSERSDADGEETNLERAGVGLADIHNVVDELVTAATYAGLFGQGARLVPIIAADSEGYVDGVHIAVDLTDRSGRHVRFASLHEDFKTFAGDWDLDDGTPVDQEKIAMWILQVAAQVGCEVVAGARAWFGPAAGADAGTAGR